MPMLRKQEVIMEATRAYKEGDFAQLPGQPTWDGNDDVCSICCLGVRRDAAVVWSGCHAKA